MHITPQFNKKYIGNLLIRSKKKQKNLEKINKDLKEKQFIFKVINSNISKSVAWLSMIYLIERGPKIEEFSFLYLFIVHCDLSLFFSH